LLPLPALLVAAASSEYNIRFPFSAKIAREPLAAPAPNKILNTSTLSVLEHTHRHDSAERRKK
jgi:hypothetical protein